MLLIGVGNYDLKDWEGGERDGMRREVGMNE